MRIYTLSKKDTRAILNNIIRTWPIILNINKFTQVKTIEINKHQNLFLFPKFNIIKFYDIFLPFLSNTEILVRFPSIEVNLGAVPHICKGADVMRPGIVKSECFYEGDIVVIQENKHKKFIAVGKALVNESDMKKMNKGVIIKNYHYIGDNFWEIYKQV